MQYIPNNFFLTFFVLVLLITHLGGCDEPETAPSYLYIDTVLLNTTSVQGSNAHNIKTVWLSLNGYSLGAYELPTTVPILATGEQQILVEAGIANSGVLSNRVKYPFYAPRSFTVDLTAQQTATLNPELSYQPDVVFDFISDFEFSNQFSVLFGNDSQMEIIDNGSLVFEGNQSLSLRTYSGSDTLIIATNDLYLLPTANAPVYVELNYRCEAPFYVTLRGYNNTDAKLSNLLLKVNAKNSWNKIYVDVEPMISELTSQYELFQVIIGAIRPDSLTQANYWFDNIKLVHQ